MNIKVDSDCYVIYCSSSWFLVYALVMKLTPEYFSLIHALPSSSYLSWSMPPLSPSVGLNTASATSIPLTTLPKGAKLLVSRRELLAKLINTWLVLVLGPSVAKQMVPLVLLPKTGSSKILLCSHFLLFSGLPEIPNWRTKFGTTRKSALSW